jgi:excisionase family DNA binding protein
MSTEAAVGGSGPLVKDNTYMTTAEVAELMRTSPETVRYWRHVGKGPGSFKAGRKVLYKRTDVEVWICGLHTAEARTG